MTIEDPPLTEAQQKFYWEMNAAQERHTALKVRVFNELDPMVIRAMAALFLSHSSDGGWRAFRDSDDDLYGPTRDCLAPLKLRL